MFSASNAGRNLLRLDGENLQMDRLGRHLHADDQRSWRVQVSAACD
jgi:hypothetical protein